ncbi:ankyrin repeat domain-containing protein [Chlamydiia bacterium]|nr:ankyrin repeat domain-containing protein [Chlamydiia bacterium]
MVGQLFFGVDKMQYNEVLTLNAIGSGSTKRLDFLKSHGIHFNWLMDDENTFEKMIITSGSTDLVRYVHQNVKPLENNVESGFYPLHYAAEKGLTEVVKYFVEERGVRLDEGDDYGRHVLFSAVKSGSLELVQYLLDKNNGICHINDPVETHKVTSDENVKSIGGALLRAAALAGNEDVFELLLSADNHELNNDKEFILANGILSCSQGVFNAMTRRGILFSDCPTALVYAAESGNIKIAEYLLSDDFPGSKSNRDVIVRDLMYYSKRLKGNTSFNKLVQNKTILHHAARSGSCKTVEFFMSECSKHKFRTEFSARNLYPYILADAARSGSDPLVDEILKKISSANVTLTPQILHLALKAAVQSGNVDMYKKLYRQLSDIEEEDGFPRSKIPSGLSFQLLFFATKNHSLEMVETTFEMAEKDLDLDKARCNHLLKNAIKTGERTIIDYLLRKGATIPSHENWRRGESLGFFLCDVVVAGSLSVFLHIINNSDAPPFEDTSFYKDIVNAAKKLGFGHIEQYIVDENRRSIDELYNML